MVLSLTSKAHQDTPTAGANLTFTSAGVSKDVYYDAIASFHASLPAMVDSGVMSVWYFTNQSFAISPLTGPNITIPKLQTLLEPLTTKLDKLNITYTSYFGQFDSYLQHFNHMFAPIEVGIAQYGGRLIPRSVVSQNNNALTDGFRFINDQGGQIIGVGINASLAVAGNPNNAVNPGWRDALLDITITTPWSFTAPREEMVAKQILMTDVLVPKLAELTPHGSCYLNEGDFRQPDFQSVFYGADNYKRLSEIKARYDPDDVFYALTAVGSEKWQLHEDGRLCRVREGTLADL